MAEYSIQWKTVPSRSQVGTIKRYLYINKNFTGKIIWQDSTDGSYWSYGRDGEVITSQDYTIIAHTLISQYLEKHENLSNT